MKHAFLNYLASIVVAIAAISMAIPAYAQDENTNNDPEDLVPVIAYFNLGEVATYHEIRSKYKVDGDTNVVYQYEINYSLEVVDSTETKMQKRRCRK